MALLDKGMKRRDFLKASAAAAAATAAVGLAGCAPSTATDMAETGGNTGAATHQVASDAAIIEGKGEWVPIHCHQNCNQMCLNMGYVVDGVVVRQKTPTTRARTVSTAPSSAAACAGAPCASRCTTPTASSTP